MSKQTENPQLETEFNEDGLAQPQFDIAEDVDIADITADELVNVDLSVEPLQLALEAAQVELEEYKNNFLLAKAETDNVRKRAERDVANAHKYALEKFIPELLTVKDSLELGTKAAKDSIAETPNEQLSKFIEGSEMTINMFADTLKKFSVEIVNSEGELFNPEFHQAMTMVPNADVPANTIIEVIQQGYTLNGRLLRPAMVIVAKKP